MPRFARPRVLLEFVARYLVLLLALGGLLTAPRATPASPAGPGPVGPWVADFETGDWTQFEIGTPASSSSIVGNWPYGELYDGGREGAPGGPRITLVNRASDPAHVRLGNYGVKISLRQGDASYGTLPDQNGTIDASWLQYFDSEDQYWCNGTATPGGQVCSPTWRTSNYRPGESRAAALPQDADVPGREAYWGMSILWGSEINYSGRDWFTGPNFHAGGGGDAGRPRAALLGTDDHERQPPDHVCDRLPLSRRHSG